jgi:phage terminase small subunit
MRKLSRREISEGLKAVPIESVLLGASNPAGLRLTAKQRKFAEEIARGETKAGAYRKAYAHKGKPKTASNEGQKLMKSPAISAQVDAMRLALERQKYTTPAALRALVIDKLTEKAIDPDIPPAQQLKALQLLGTVTEVAAFTQRSETVRVTDSAEIREKLLASIRQAIRVDAIDVETLQSDDLLAEIAQGRAAATAEPPADADPAGADPTPAPPPADDLADSQAVIHTIPLSQSSLETHLPDLNGESNRDTQGA